MVNEVLRARITESYLGVVDINGYKYNKHLMQVEMMDDIPVLMPVFEDIYPGDCFESVNWVLTSLDVKKKPTDIIIRVDSFERCSSQGFGLSKYLNARVIGMLCTSSKCVLKEVGVDCTPFYNATIKVKNSFKESFPLYVLGFFKVAKKLSTIPSGTVVEAVVTVKRRRNGDGWEFPISTIEVKSEVIENA